MKRIANLMKIDLIALGGKKNSAFIGLIVLFVIFTVYSYFIPCFLAFYIPFFSALLVSMIVKQELAFDYGKTFCVVPTDRKSVVLARFLMTVSAVTAVSLILYAVMRIMMLFSTEIAEFYEVMAEFFNIGISMTALCNIIFSGCLALGLIIMSANLRKYFRYGAVNKKNSLLRTVLIILLVYIILVIVVSALIYSSKVPFVQTVYNLTAGIFYALSRPAEGLLLSLTLIVIGYGAAAYQTVCAVIEYDEREL